MLMDFYEEESAFLSTYVITSSLFIIACLRLYHECMVVVVVVVIVVLVAACACVSLVRVCLRAPRRAKNDAEANS